MNARVFTADYDKSDIATRVWLPLGVAAVLGMAGLLLGYPLMSLAAGVLTFIALRSWPLTRDQRPALTLNNSGIEIDGLGQVRWNDVIRVESGVVQINSEKRPAIDLAFSRPIQEVFTATAATRLRPWEIRVFKLRKDGKMRLDLSRMEDKPEEILAAFRHFHGGVL
ncbi:MAG: hypothetical protein CMK06_07480 [Ponticaulis sp.]|nr:hypothetical protein [Ponticaulis sp.]|tara:strand:- start:32344 stop:32844 length:501 start_codon:yes stop_codon:yes gene_type:complete